MGQGKVFTLFHPHPGGGGGYPSPRFFPRSFLGRYPSPGLGVPHPWWGIPIPGQKGMGCSQPGQDGVPPSQDWGNPLPQPGQDGVPPGQDWGTPLPPPLNRTAERVLATRRAVCLLRSRRRTLLSSRSLVSF